MFPTWELIRMAHRGPDSKAVKLGRTPNADWVEVPDVPFEGPWPDLPKLSGRQKWNDLAIRWWDIAKRLPHAALWDDSDWQYVLETVFMKHYYFRDVQNDEGTTSAATEIRRREDNIGTTMEARRKLRIKYVDPEQPGVQDPVGTGAESDDRPAKVVEQTGPGPGGGTVTPLAERRKRLTSKSA